MLQGCKIFHFLQPKIIGEILRGFIKTFLLFSVAIVISYTLLSSPRYLLRFPSCDRPTISTADPNPPTNLSHIVFGIGGSAHTWHNRRVYSELWWRPGEMRGHVWLDEGPIEGDWSPESPPWRVTSVGSAQYGNRAAAARMARIVTEAYAMRMEGVRWFVMGDDDTVFFPENLVAVLGKYDYEQMYYIGAPSESVVQDQIHSYGMAFGGGGFAVSYPAAAALSGAIDGCLDRYANFYGSDERVHACFSELGVPLTREPGFHQVDLRRDAYGMLAAHPVAPLVSLHHLDYVQPISPLFPSQLEAVRSLVSAARADPARTLQQSICYLTGHSPDLNWSLSVSWGYTVQIYPWIVAPKDLEEPLRTFETWRGFKKGPFGFNTRELAPPALPCKRPLRFFLSRKAEGGNGTVTEYKRFKWEDDDIKECHEPGFRAANRVERVRVFAQRMDPNVWKKAPRRQCCDVRRKREGESIEMRIRECGPIEATSPHEFF